VQGSRAATAAATDPPSPLPPPPPPQACDGDMALPSLQHRLPTAALPDARPPPLSLPARRACLTADLPMVRQLEALWAQVQPPLPHQQHRSWPLLQQQHHYFDSATEFLTATRHASLENIDASSHHGRLVPGVAAEDHSGAAQPVRHVASMPRLHGRQQLRSGRQRRRRLRLTPVATDGSSGSGATPSDTHRPAAVAAPAHRSIGSASAEPAMPEDSRRAQQAAQELAADADAGVPPSAVQPAARDLLRSSASGSGASSTSHG